MKKCKFCNNEYDNKSIGGHTANCILNPNRLISIAKSKQNAKIANENKKKERREKYYLSPKKCIQCDKIIIYEKQNNKFCGSNCSAIYNNKFHKKVQDKKRIFSEIGKENIRKSCIKRIKFNYNNSKKSYCLNPNYCIICNKKLVFEKRTNKTCSDVCYRTHLSRLASIRISKVENRKNFGRGKKSYLELSFEIWLKNKNIDDYEPERKFVNTQLENKKNYFVDFTFEDKKVIVELDGTQHFKTKEQDAVRDEYLTSIGYNVVRISYKEYKNKTKENLLISLLT